MNWLSIVLVLLQFAPDIIAAVKSLVDAISGKNAAKGKEAATRSFELATQIVASLASRARPPGMDDADWNAKRREMAWKDLTVAARMSGIELSESDARTLSELALKKLKNA